MLTLRRLPERNMSTPSPLRSDSSTALIWKGLLYLLVSGAVYLFLTIFEHNGGVIVIPRILVLIYVFLGKWPLVAIPGLVGGFFLLAGISEVAFQLLKPIRKSRSRHTVGKPWVNRADNVPGVKDNPPPPDVIYLPAPRESKDDKPSSKG